MTSTRDNLELEREVGLTVKFRMYGKVSQVEQEAQRIGEWLRVVCHNPELSVELDLVWP